MTLMVFFKSIVHINCGIRRDISREIPVELLQVHVFPVFIALNCTLGLSGFYEPTSSSQDCYRLQEGRKEVKKILDK